VRDAFNRLANLDLLLIRPQKATEVRGFSISRISQARFVRLAVELEVVKRACAVWDESCANLLDASLTRQRKAIELGEVGNFHELDYEFHKLICELSGNGIVVETIRACKIKIDRLCLLSLGNASEAPDVLREHQELAEALGKRDSQGADRIVRRHLSRLDRTIRAIRDEHAEYFED
jgi:DNA-binding GntR family transcriptional regulator